MVAEHAALLQRAAGPRVRVPDVVEPAPGDPARLAGAGPGPRRRLPLRRQGQGAPGLATRPAHRRHQHLRRAVDVRQAAQRRRSADADPGPADELRAAHADDVARPVLDGHRRRPTSGPPSSTASSTAWPTSTGRRRREDARRPLPPGSGSRSPPRCGTGRRGAARRAATRCASPTSTRCGFDPVLSATRAEHATSSRAPTRRSPTTPPTSSGASNSCSSTRRGGAASRPC